MMRMDWEREERNVPHEGATGILPVMMCKVRGATGVPPVREPPKHKPNCNATSNEHWQNASGTRLEHEALAMLHLASADVQDES